MPLNCAEKQSKSLTVGCVNFTKIKNIKKKKKECAVRSVAGSEGRGQSYQEGTRCSGEAGGKRERPPLLGVRPLRFCSSAEGRGTERDRRGREGRMPFTSPCHSLPNLPRYPLLVPAAAGDNYPHGLKQHRVIPLQLWSSEVCDGSIGLVPPWGSVREFIFVPPPASRDTCVPGLLPYSQPADDLVTLTMASISKPPSPPRTVPSPS